MKRQVNPRISVRLSEGMLNDIKASMSVHGYGQRQFSKWVSDAIVHLREMDGYWIMIASEEMANATGKSQVLTLSADAVTCLSEMSRETGNKLKSDKSGFEVSESLHDLQTRIIRAACVHLYLKLNPGGGGEDIPDLDELFD